MKRIETILAFVLGICLSINAQTQTITVGTPVVTHPKQSKFKAVEAQDKLHAIEGSSAVYKITVAGYDSIENVISLKYNNTDATSYYHLNKGKLTIDDIQISDFKANETIDFQVTLIVREKGKNEDTKRSAKAETIIVYPEPVIQKVEAPFSAFKKESGTLKWSATGEGGGKWVYSWKSTDNVTNNSETYEHPSIKNNEQTIKSIDVTLSAVNYAPDGTTEWDTYNDSWTIKVFPEVVVAPSVEPNDLENSCRKFQGNSWDLAVSAAGGNPDGWEIEWLDVDSGNSLSKNMECKVTGQNAKEKETKHIRLNVKNNPPKDADPELGIWFDENYDYFVDFYPIPNVEFGEYPPNVLDGNIIQMQVKLSDSAYMNDYLLQCEWNDSQSGQTYTFKASNNNNEDGVQKKVAVKYSLSLKNSDESNKTGDYSHVFTVWPNPSVSLSLDGNESSNPYQLFQDGKIDLSVSSYGGYKTGWTYIWKDENDKEIIRGKKYTLACEKLSDEVQSKHIKLTVTNESQNPTEDWFNKTYDYYVNFYPTPIIKFAEDYRKNIKHGDDVLMTLTIQDANGNIYTDSYDVDYSWNNGESHNSIYEFKGFNTNNNDGESVSVTLDGVVKLKGTDLEKPYKLKHDFVVWPLPIVYTDNLGDRVACGGQTLVFSVTANGGKKDGWTYEWTADDALLDDTTNEYILNLNNAPIEGHVVSSYKVKVVNTCDREKWFEETYPFSVTVYPEPRIPEDVVIIDKNRGGEVSTGIREGNKIILHCDECSGGYPDAWSYKWKRNNVELGSDKEIVDDVPMEYKGSGKANDMVIDYSCSVENWYYSTLWKQHVYPKEIKVYHRPQTPTSIVKKGNGTSETIIATTSVSDTDLEGHEYYLVFGYLDNNGQTHDATSQKQQNPGEVRWSKQISSSEVDNPNNKLYVYALWKYNDGVEITSGIRYIDSIDEDWDGSTYDGTTRTVIANATAIDNVNFDAGKATPIEYFSTGGKKSLSPSKGFNIIRMCDGTVKKVMIK